MTDDLAAINLLSDRLYETLQQSDRLKDGRNSVLYLRDEYISQGEKILHMYASEFQKSPADMDVILSISLHQYRMGYMYYDAIYPMFLPKNSAIKRPVMPGDDKLDKDAARNADAACFYLYQSYMSKPNCSAAMVLADIFRLAGFYGTMHYWFNQVEAGSDGEMVTRARAQRLDLTADGKTVDPVLKNNSAFPTRATFGLMLDFQPAMPTPAATSRPAIPSSPSVSAPPVPVQTLSNPPENRPTGDQTNPVAQFVQSQIPSQFQVGIATCIFGVLSLINTLMHGYLLEILWLPLFLLGCVVAALGFVKLQKQG